MASTPPQLIAHCAEAQAEIDLGRDGFMYIADAMMFFLSRSMHFRPPGFSEVQQREQAPRRSQHEPGAAPPEPAWLTAGLADALHLPRQPCRLPAPASLHPRLLALHLLAQGGQALGQVLLRPGFHPLSPRLKHFRKCLHNSVSQSASSMNSATLLFPFLF